MGNELGIASATGRAAGFPGRRDTPWLAFGREFKGRTFGVRKLGDKLGRSDDRSVVYRTDDAEQRVSWVRLVGSYLTASLVVGALVVAGRAMDVEGLVIASVLIVALVSLALYVAWRRRRNERLTGSPTRWPSE